MIYFLYIKSAAIPSGNELANNYYFSRLEFLSHKFKWNSRDLANAN